MSFVYEASETALSRSVFNNLSSFQDLNDTINYNEAPDLPISYQIFVVIIGTMIVVLNLIVVTTSGLVVKKGLEPRCTYLLLGNLSLTDTLIGVLAIVGTVYLKNLKYHNRLACCIQIGIFVSSMMVSIYTVTLIAIDRFLYIIYGIKYNQLVYPKRVRCMITFTWIFGLTIGLLPSFGWTNEWRQGELCRFATLFPQNLIILTVTIATVPIPVILVTYVIILVKALRTIGQIATESRIQRRNVGDIEQTPNRTGLRMSRGGYKISTISGSTSDHSSSGYSSSNSIEMLPNIEASTNILYEPYKANKKKWKAIKVVLFTTGAYIVSWTPICIDIILLGFCDQVKTPDKCLRLRSLSKYLSILAFMNCVLNPIIYAWWHNGFRKAAKKIFSIKKRNFMEWCQSATLKVR